MTKSAYHFASQEKQTSWESCVRFHGHSCGGLAIGFQAAVLASELLDVTFSPDEEIVCITENDACGVDAISIILGCSIGKGNLLLRIRGKQAFTFYNRMSGQGVRLVYKPQTNIQPEDREAAILSAEPRTLFSITEPSFQLPEEAIIFKSLTCEFCGEQTAEPYIRLTDGKHACMDCYHEYKRIF